TVRWPSGAAQEFEQVPISHRVELVEGSSEVKSTPFAVAPLHAQRAETKVEPLPEVVESWLLQPLRAPSFSLTDTAGKTWDLHSLSGKKLVVFLTSASAESRSQIETISRHQG